MARLKRGSIDAMQVSSLQFFCATIARENQSVRWRMRKLFTPSTL
jgi:hypothetical protein